MLHSLKLNRVFADNILLNDLSFCICKNDFTFQKGDFVRFTVVQSDDTLCCHDLNELTFEITYVLSGWGISPEYVVFGFRSTIPHMDVD